MDVVITTSLVSLAIIFLVSGAAKLLAPGNGETRFAVMPLPAVVNQKWLRTALPWAEIVVALGLVLSSGVILWGATAAAVVLLASFTVFVVMGVRQNDPASCGCFGALSRAPMSWRTVVRNVVILAVSVLAFLAVSTGDYLGPALALPWFTTLAFLIPAALLGVIVWSEVAGRGAAVKSRPLSQIPPLPQTYRGHSPSPIDMANADSVSPANASSWASSEEDVENVVDYVRTPIPHVTLRQRDGERVALRTLATGQAQLLVAVNPGCGPCRAIVEELTPFADGIGPVALHMVVSFQDAVEVLPEPLQARALVQEDNLFSATFGMSGTPWAVLLGSDGLLAGGPETGYERIKDMLDELKDRF